MRPGQECPGKPEFRKITALRLTSFNEAGAGMPRKTYNDLPIMVVDSELQ